MRVSLLGAALVAAMAASPLMAGTANPSQPAVTAEQLAEASRRIIDGKANINGVRYHYLLAKGGPQTVVLLHGWGSTSYMWRFVMPQLAARRYTVLAPDLRGLGDTTKPAGGYDKATIAQDIHGLVAHLGLGPRINLAGHDMGGMVAYAYAAQHPEQLSTLTIMDVPLPGIEPWNEITQSPRAWHFHFHSVQDLPEALISGRELEYFKWFHNAEAINSRAFDNQTDEIYGRAYAMPGALRAGFEYYRAFPQDIQANQAFARHKLPMPVLGIGGEGGMGAIIGDHLRHVAGNVRAVNIQGAGHWVAEEQPAAVTDALLAFLPAAH